ncbi:SDR family NAD(P)-dependent oxidoreductase [Psychroflexus aestuariivivens]|uniref:SDR family NAD(P)-dependent oxidoreductase n=1 Tax=Psychroflexus aestuariivivens TaxID=1795040 RepID=UPI001960D7C4|nr:SDR family oxidoreductase [Psychroflexus aestuariivivens]
MIDLKGKNALITGSSRGVGQQVAQGLANLGCNIIVHGRTRESCTKTLDMLEKFEVNTYCVFGELSDESQMDHLINQVKDLKISVDILYNNAAIMSPYRPDFWSHSYEDWMSSFKVNVYAMYKLSAAFIPAMIENGFGRVVNLTSGIRHEPELAPYAASKWAVNKLTDDIAIKLEKTNVRINMLDPGWLRTDLGGSSADHAVEEVLPGALAPALIENDGPNGHLFSAIVHNLNTDDFKN